MPSLITTPVRVAAVGTPPKVIEEFVGRVASKTESASWRACAARPAGPSRASGPSSTS